MRASLIASIYLKMVKMANFILPRFYHNFKKCLNVTYQKPFNYGANQTLKGFIVSYVNCITAKLFL